MSAVQPKRKAISISEVPPSKKRAVTVQTVEKWKLENEKAIGTASWLQYDKAADRQHVSALQCSVCVKFEESIRSCRNFNPAFIHGSTNLRASSFKEHARTDMYARAMLLLRKEQASDVTEYTPIARVLTMMDSHAEEMLKKKFDVAYVLAKEGITFAKMMHVCQDDAHLPTHGTSQGRPRYWI